MQNVEGKVAFITGAASGIGLGMAKVFLRHRMKVVVADLLEDRLAEAAVELLPYGPNFHLLQLDVTDREAMALAAEETLAVFGKVHIVCNNAGVAGIAPIDEASYEEWDWVLGVNLGGVNGIVSFVHASGARGGRAHRNLIDGGAARAASGVFTHFKLRCAAHGHCDCVGSSTSAHRCCAPGSRAAAS
jgi:NAD(P)-dependent dehydrogenase (short-subunit alcohol dehydrogenase family)